MFETVSATARSDWGKGSRDRETSSSEVAGSMARLENNPCENFRPMSADSERDELICSKCPRGCSANVALSDGDRQIRKEREQRRVLAVLSVTAITAAAAAAAAPLARTMGLLHSSRQPRPHHLSQVRTGAARGSKAEFVPHVVNLSLPAETRRLSAPRVRAPLRCNLFRARRRTKPKPRAARLEPLASRSLR
ncbi:unnamed protein product [Lampetra fluviatilis]